MIETLSVRLRLVSLDLAARAWWGDGPRAIRGARERFAKLESIGLVARRRVNVHPLLPLSEPLLVWSPGDSDPHFGRVAYRLQRRWSEPLCLTSICFATRKAAQQFGGTGPRIRRRTQLTHDLHVAAVYFRLLARDPSVRHRWRGEDQVAAEFHGKKVPDAVLTSSAGVPQRVIEFGGRYDARRLKRHHNYFANQEMAYELW